MPDLSTQRRLAASILRVGISRIYIDPDHAEDASEAITRDDVRTLINSGIIDVRPPSTPTRGRKRLKKIKKSRGKRKGHGSRKGGKGVRRDPERMWVRRVRKQRNYIRSLYLNGKIERRAYRSLYLKIKGGVFPTLASLKNFVGKQV
jgi:large subunit ribosomal protein L19e